MIDGRHAKDFEQFCAETVELNKSEVIKPFDAEQIAPPLYTGINV